MEYGAHLPLIDLAASRSLPALKAYARTAAALGFRYLCANDHLLFSRPWLDGPTALAALIDDSDDMRLATTASLPVLRGPVQLAKTLVAIDILSGGRLVVGVGPGSSAADYAAAGLGFGERWRRFDEAVQERRDLPGRSRGLQPAGLRGHDQALRRQHRLDRSLAGPDVQVAPGVQQFALPLCELWHFDSSGRVVGGDLYYDQVSLLTQLGLMPQPSG